MIKIYLKDIHCNEETDEVGSDEPFVLVTTVNLPATVPVQGIALPLPAFEVVRYGHFNDVDQGETHAAPGISRSFWGLTGNPTAINNPDDVIFAVCMMEKDSGDAETLRGIVKGIVGGSVLSSLSFSRADKVAKLIADIQSAMGTPTGAPNFDDKIDLPKELRFTTSDISLAESGQTVSKTMNFEGDGGKYTLTFEVRQAGWRKWFPISPGTGFEPGPNITALEPRNDHVDLFCTDKNGAVWSTWWEPTPGWQPWFQIPSRSNFLPFSTITALVPRDDHIDLFGIDREGGVWSTWWEPTRGWQPWFQISPGPRFQPGAAISAMEPRENHIDLWAPDQLGVLSAFWEA